MLAAGACGLADDERREENRYIYPVFSDKTFEAYCIREFDLDGNGRISRYEAQRVVRVECSGLGIATLYDIAEFSNLRELDCSGNDLATLDVSMLAHLERLDCSHNRLATLEVGGAARPRLARCRRQSAAAARPVVERLTRALRRTRLRLCNARRGALRPGHGAGRRARMRRSGCPLHRLRAADLVASLRRGDAGCRALTRRQNRRTVAAPPENTGRSNMLRPFPFRFCSSFGPSAHRGETVFSCGAIFHNLLKSTRPACFYSKKNSYLWKQKMSFALNF